MLPMFTNRPSRVTGVRRLSLNLKRAHYAALTLLMVVLALTVLWISREHTKLARDSSAQLVESAINTVEERVRTITLDYSYWNEAYEAAKTRDLDWLHANIGTGATQTEVVGRIGIAYGMEGENFGWRIGGSAEPTTGIIPDPILEALISQIEDRPVDSTTVLSSYQRMDGAVWLFAIARIVPYHYDSIDWSEQTQIFQIHGIEMDQALLAETGKTVLVKGLSLVEPDIRNENLLMLRDHQGTAIAGLSWELPSPGTDILRKIALPLVLALGTVVVAAIFLSRIAEKSASRLEHALEAAQTADRVKAEFLANVTHELRTPIHGVVNLAELLRETELTEDQSEMLGYLLESAETHRELLEHILDYSHIESGRRPLSFVRFQPVAALEEIAKATRISCESKDLEFAFMHDAGSRELEVVGDKIAFKQIVSNLCTNAVKYTGAGSVALELRHSVSAGAATLVVTVSDTGCGIDPADSQRIFDQFTQLESRIGGHAAGAGLGLSISRSLAEAMGGRIELTSAPRRGSTFTLTVALEIADEADRSDGIAA